jgi:hypothetical protein
VERGSHAALLAAEGLYAAMWQRQAVSDAERERAENAEPVAST